LEDVEQLCSLVALLRKGQLKTYSPMDKLLKQEEQKYDITVGPLTNDIRQKLFKGDQGRKTALGVCFTVEGTESLKKDLEELTQNHVPIFNITMHRTKLEEALFLDEELQKSTEVSR
jgi:ABC-type multidrug transport system ATPase subunit